MAETSIGTRCPECERLRARVADLETRLAAAQKHSGNSSKPPSSDIVKPPKGRRGRNPRSGGAVANRGIRVTNVRSLPPKKLRPSIPTRSTSARTAVARFARPQPHPW